MTSIFIIIHRDLLSLIPGREGSSLKACAAALLNYFKNQRDGWLTLNLDQLQEVVMHQWGRETVRKAAQLLANEQLIERKHHRMNGRAWMYRFSKKVTVAPTSDAVTPVEASVTPDNVTSIYKDPLKNPQQDPSDDVEKISCEELKEAEQEIKKLRINPGVIRRELLKNFANFKGAVAAVKQSQDAGWVKNPAGLLIKFLREGNFPPAPEKFEIPIEPETIADYCQSHPEIRDYFFSSVDQAYKIVFQNGSQKLWSEVQL